MSTTLLNAMTLSLLTMACLTAFADSDDAADSSSAYMQAVGRNASHSMHPNAPLAAGQFADDDSIGSIQAGGRNGSHSMHPDAPVAAEQFADDDGQVLQLTGDK